MTANYQTLVLQKCFSSNLQITYINCEKVCGSTVGLTNNMKCMGAMSMVKTANSFVIYAIGLAKTYSA